VASRGPDCEPLKGGLGVEHFVQNQGERSPKRRKRACRPTYDIKPEGGGTMHGKEKKSVIQGRLRFNLGVVGVLLWLRGERGTVT